LRLKAKGNINPDYLRLVLHTYDLLKVYYGMGSGLRQNLDYSRDFKRLPIILPPRAEQLSIAQHVSQHPDYEAQVANNPDEQNKRLALEKLISQAVGQERRRELDLYKRYASDPDFKRAFDASIMRILSSGSMGQMGV
jgi:hypothetical protein